MTRGSCSTRIVHDASGRRHPACVVLRLGRLGILVALTGILAGCGGEPQLALPNTPTPDPAVASPPARPAASPEASAPVIGDLTWTSAIDPETGAPADALAHYPADAPRLLIAARARAIQADSNVEARWYYNDTPLEAFTTRHAFSGPVMDQWLGFHLDRADDTTWPAGTYEIEIFLDGEPEADATIEVVSGP